MVAFYEQPFLIGFYCNYSVHIFRQQMAGPTDHLAFAQLDLRIFQNCLKNYLPGSANPFQIEYAERQNYTCH